MFGGFSYSVHNVNEYKKKFIPPTWHTHKFPLDIKLLIIKLYSLDSFHLHYLVQVEEYGLVPFGEFFFHSSISFINWGYLRLDVNNENTLIII